MSDRLLKESDVMRIAFQLPYVVNSSFFDAVKALPSADRPQGEWIGGEIPTRCPICEHDWDEYVFGPEYFYTGDIPKYCPNCGARMRPRLQGKHFDSIIIDELAMKGADNEDNH